MERVLGRQLARELTADEIDRVSGAGVFDTSSLINTVDNTICDTGYSCAVDDIEFSMDA